MTPRDRFLAEHQRLTRRYFLGLGAAGAAAVQLGQGASKAAEPAPELAQTLQQLELARFVLSISRSGHMRSVEHHRTDAHGCVTKSFSTVIIGRNMRLGMSLT